MKKVFLISALLILVITSCKKEPTSANIKRIVVTEFPSMDGTSDWDVGSGPDLYIKIAVNGTVVWSAPSYNTDAVNTTDYSFTPSSAILISNLAEDVQVDFYDYEDGVNDQWMGGVIFQLEDYKDDTPSSKDLVTSSGNHAITVDIDWVTG